MIKHIFGLTSALVIVSLAVLIMLLPSPAPTSSNEDQQSEASSTQTNNVFIQNVRVFTGSEFIEKQNIRVVNGVFQSISSQTTPKPNETLIDGQGLSAIPGLIDAHTHSFGQALSDSLRFGVSTHLDMFTAEDNLLASQLKRSSFAQSNEADLFSSGVLATVKNGHGTQFGMAVETIDNLDEIDAWVSARKQAGADYIKLVYMPYQSAFPSLNLATASALIEASHAQGMRVYAHISSQAAAKDMISAGINGLVHIFADSIVSDDLLILAKQNEVVIIPTLAVIASVDHNGDNESLAKNAAVSPFLSAQQMGSLQAQYPHALPGFELTIAKQNVKRFFDAGVPILAGSDAPNPGTAYGISLHHEMALLVASGLTPTQALMAASSIPAKHFALSKRGQITENARADFVLINGDINTNIASSLDIVKVFKNGYLVQRELPKQEASSVLSSGLLGNFDSPELLTINNFIWSHSDDSMANGDSVATIEHVQLDGNNGVLKVQATIGNGFAYPWAGAAVGDFKAPVSPVDVSAYTSLSFKVKGTPGNYRVMAFSSTMAGVPPSQNIELTEQWQSITLSLNDFAGFDQSKFSGFAFVAGPVMGEYEFMLDDVSFVK